MAEVDDYPGVSDVLDDTDDYLNSFSEVNVSGNRFLVVTQRGEIDAGQSVFRWNDESWELFDSDNFVDISGAERFRVLSGERTKCGKASDKQHADFYEHVVAEVNNFSSAKGPDGGNLACVWAIRHLAKEALGYWITRTDGTAIFDPELQKCFGSTWQEADAPAGAIIISPTVTLKSGKRNVGHVGIVGPVANGGDRLIYSNSSSRARWEQNFTLSSWIARYRAKKGLRIRFYPLPFFD